MAARAGGSGGPSNRCRVPPHATKSSNQPTAHIGRGASHDSDFSLSMKIVTRLMEVLPRPRGGTVSIRCGIHGVDGHQGRFECRIKASVLLEMKWSVVCHHKAVARQRGGALPLDGHRYARCAPGKVGSPTEITVSAGCRPSITPPSCSRKTLHDPCWTQRMMASPVHPSRAHSELEHMTFTCEVSVQA